jgi:hypothetical protein
MTPLETLQSQRAALVAQISATARISTPQLGEVEFRPADDLTRALALLDSQIAAASGQSATGVFTLQSDRGLS